MTFKQWCNKKCKCTTCGKAHCAEMACEEIWNAAKNYFPSYDECIKHFGKIPRGVPMAMSFINGAKRMYEIIIKNKV